MSAVKQTLRVFQKKKYEKKVTDTGIRSVRDCDAHGFSGNGPFFTARIPSWVLTSKADKNKSIGLTVFL